MIFITLIDARARVPKGATHHIWFCFLFKNLPLQKRVAFLFSERSYLLLKQKKSREIKMASLSHDLESLNLNLPDVVVEAEVSTASTTSKTSETTKKSVRNRKNRRGGANKKLPQTASEASDVKVEELGACALPKDDQRHYGRFYPNYFQQRSKKIRCWF